MFLKKHHQNPKIQTPYTQKSRVLLQYYSMRNWYCIVIMHLLGYYVFDFNSFLQVSWGNVLQLVSNFLTILHNSKVVLE